MPIRWIEHKESRDIQDGPSPKAELVFLALGSNDPAEVLAEAAAGAVPATFLGLVAENVSPKWIGYEKFKVYVTYSLRELDDAETWDTSGGTQHIQHSRATVASYAIPSATAPNFRNAINCDGQRVGGTDITIPVFNYTRTKTLPLATVDEAYKLQFYNATGKTNSTTMHGFAIGEVLMLGASGSQRGREKYQITVRYAASPNLSGLEIGQITGITKAGWDFLWVYFVDDISGSSLVQKPYAAYVERVYQSTDLTALGF
jgi:hypothetical protein